MVNTFIERNVADWKPTHKKLAELLLDPKTPLFQRYRALFSLKNLADKPSVDIIIQCLREEKESDLLLHELTYCLGQMKSKDAINVLCETMADPSLHAMVRHEAAESLGAISQLDTIPELEKFLNDDCKPLADTCLLAIEKIKYDHSPDKQKEDPAPEEAVHTSIDPVPATTNTKSIAELRTMLCDQEAPLWKRYRALFALRDINNDDAVHALAEAMETDVVSSLLRHEIGFVFGEMQNPASVPSLSRVLANTKEEPMVRHEAAEALGSVATPEVFEILKKFTDDPVKIVRDSCIVALDMFDYEQSGEFQYAIVPKEGEGEKAF
ncbi:deoxyhypusine hydroxylase [Mycoemilia scoparia]|uniref:Deoxyhypusine hydroxylase n=1 Tax=Mycoemilia scoparia TaxID=417184 RepID=A0A9W7ZTE5_9FUNG|nr:deoxyhypusine hydroxylase [Mycoemilia scoparia]